METKKFLRKLEETLEVEENSLETQTNLNDLVEYDSLAVLSIIAMVDEEFDKKIPGKDFQSVTTVKSLMDLIGEDNFE